MRIVKHKKNGQFFALKIMKKGEIIRLKQVDHVLSEMTILMDIDHPFLVVSIVYLLHIVGQNLWSQPGLKGNISTS